MQSFQLDINQHIRMGLRPDERGTVGLEQCFNLQPTELGLRPREAISQVVSASELSNNSITVGFPYPQVFIGKEVGLLCTQDSLFEIDLDAATLTSIAVYDGNDPETTTTLTGGSTWHFIDFHSTWMLTNGVELIFKDNRGIFSGEANKVLRLTSPVIKTMCDFKFRPIYAGFTSNPFNSIWQNFFALDPDKTGIDEQEMSLGQNAVFFGSPGGGDMMWLLYPHLMDTGYLQNEELWDELRRYFFEYIKKMTMGWLYMDSPGEILRVLPMEDVLMVYSEDAVHIMPTIQEPMPTLGMKKILNVGIESRSAAGGYDGRHLFVDKEGYLWERQIGQAAKRLGYREFLSGLSNIVITYAPSSGHNQEGDFYISDSSRCFVYRDGRLSETSLLVTSAGRFNAGAVGIYEDTSDDSVVIVSSPLHQSIPGTKTINSVGVVGRESASPKTMKAGLDYTHDMNRAFTRTPLVQINQEGNAYPCADGLSHRIVVTADDYSAVEIDGINYWIQFDDKRNVIGLTGEQSND